MSTRRRHIARSKCREMAINDRTEASQPQIARPSARVPGECLTDGGLAVLAYYLTLYLHATIFGGSRRMRGNAIQGGLDAIPGSLRRTNDGRGACNDLCPFDRRVGR